MNFLNAVSTLARTSGSLLIVRFAELEPVSIPVILPRRRPPMPRKEYVAMSPKIEGFKSGAMSGMTSIRYQSISRMDYSMKDC